MKQRFNTPYAYGDCVQIREEKGYPITGGIIVKFTFSRMHTHCSLLGDEDLQVHDNIAIEDIYMKSECCTGNICEVQNWKESLNGRTPEFEIPPVKPIPASDFAPGLLYSFLLESETEANKLAKSNLETLTTNKDSE